MQETQEMQVQSSGQEAALEKEMTTSFSILGFPLGSAGKESMCSVGDLGLIPGLGRSHGEGKGYHSNILAWRIP